MLTGNDMDLFDTLAARLDDVDMTRLGIIITLLGLLIGGLWVTLDSRRNAEDAAIQAALLSRLESPLQFDVRGFPASICQGETLAYTVALTTTTPHVTPIVYRAIKELPSRRTLYWDEVPRPFGPAESGIVPTSLPYTAQLDPGQYRIVVNAPAIFFEPSGYWRDIEVRDCDG